MKHSLVIYEGPWWRDLRPLSWLRPTWGVRCGGESILERAERLVGDSARVIGRSAAAAPEVPDRPRYTGGPGLFLDGRWLAGAGDWVETLGDGHDRVLEDGSGRVVGIQLSSPPDDIDAALRGGAEAASFARASAGRLTVPGRWLDRAWHPMEGVGDEIAAEFEALGRSGVPELGPGTHLAGDRFHWGEGATCQGSVFLDSRSGPIVVAAGARIGAGSIVQGPAYIGPSSQLFSARLEGGVSLGPQCRIGGEIQTVVVQGFSNKYHDGFLGHAHLCAWVNLGAGTTNSDLKNTYGPVSVNLGDGALPTGSMKIGCFLGDHVKTSIGTLLFTGTVVDPGVTLFAGPAVTGFVPAFVWAAHRGETVGFRRFLRVARTVAERRGVEIDARAEEVLADLHAETDASRRGYLERRRS